MKLLHHIANTVAIKAKKWKPLQKYTFSEAVSANVTLLFYLILVLAAAGCLAWYFLYARYYESTDDAYVNGNQVALTPQISGTVTQVTADEGDFVEKGQPLVLLDPSDTRIALQQAEASLANTVRQVRGLYSTADNYRAQVAAKQVALQTAQNDYARRQKIFSTGAIAAEDLSHYRDAVSSAQSDLAAAQQALRTNLAMVDDTVIDSHPEIKTAVATLRQRYLDNSRTTIVAPVSGYVAKRAVQLGMRVTSGTTLLAIVPLNEVWVDANFKESQMNTMRLGQKVTLNADLYGDDVEYHGTIESLGIGTGSAFSLLPAQNASGNWIKIVQRLPVRITLDPHDMQKHPLRVGLSMNARVDIRNMKMAIYCHNKPLARLALPLMFIKTRWKRQINLWQKSFMTTAMRQLQAPIKRDVMQDKAAFTPPNMWLAVLALSLATFMQVLDSTIANVALPTIAGNLGVSADQGTWVITSFAVCNAIALPLTGWFTRRFGQLKLFIGSVVMFTLTSFLCGFAHSMTELIFFRALQGFFAGPMFPMCQTLLLVIFPSSKRSMALALLSMVTVVAPIVGPITGGWITDNYSWPWIFYINVPIGIFASIVVWTQLRSREETTTHSRHRLYRYCAARHRRWAAAGGAG